MLRMFSYSRRPKSGQITCYLNRTYHVLTTAMINNQRKPGIVEDTGNCELMPNRHGGTLRHRVLVSHRVLRAIPAAQACHPSFGEEPDHEHPRPTSRVANVLDLVVTRTLHRPPANQRS